MKSRPLCNTESQGLQPVSVGLRGGGGGGHVAQQLVDDLQHLAVVLGGKRGGREEGVRPGGRGFPRGRE